LEAVSISEAASASSADVFEILCVNSSDFGNPGGDGVQIFRIADSVDSVPGPGEVCDPIGSLHQQDPLPVTDVDSESIRHVIISLAGEPTEEGREGTVHQPQHYESDGAEDEHPDTADYHGLAELLLRWLPSHLEDSGVGSGLEATNAPLDSILPALHSLLYRTDIGTFDSHD